MHVVKEVMQRVSVTEGHAFKGSCCKKNMKKMLCFTGVAFSFLFVSLSVSLPSLLSSVSVVIHMVIQEYPISLS